MDLSQLQGVSVSGIFIILFVHAITALIKVVKGKRNGPTAPVYAPHDPRSAGEKMVMASRVERIEGVVEKLVDHEQRQTASLERLTENVNALTENVNRIARRLETSPGGVGGG